MTRLVMGIGLRDTYTARGDAIYPVTDGAYPMDLTRLSIALEKRGRTATWENQNY